MPQQGTASTIRRKLVIVGDGACGKTSLLSVFTLGRFPEQYLPTVFESYVADCIVDGRAVELALWDTAGQEDYERLRPLAYHKANVILIAFAIDRPDSFDNAETKVISFLLQAAEQELTSVQWTPECSERCAGAPILLIGLKRDLRDNSNAQANLRQGNVDFITPREGANLARKIGAKRYLECSALTGEGVDDVFEAAARVAILVSEHKASKIVVLYYRVS